MDIIWRTKNPDDEWFGETADGYQAHVEQMHETYWCLIVNLGAPGPPAAPLVYHEAEEDVRCLSADAAKHLAECVVAAHRAGYRWPRGEI